MFVGNGLRGRSFIFFTAQKPTNNQTSSPKPAGYFFNFWKYLNACLQIFFNRDKSYSSPYLTEYIRVLSWNPLSLLYSDANHIRLADMKCPLGKWRFLHLVCFNRFFYFPLKNSDTSWFANRVYQSSPPQTMFILLCFFSDLFEK